MNVNEEYTVIDCNTGKEFKLVFTGGENHAEAELASESELEAFNYICGSEYNFLKRPVVVMFGETAVAAQFNAIRTAAIPWRITAWKACMPVL